MKPTTPDDASLALAKHVARTLRGWARAHPDAVEAAVRSVVSAERAGHACVTLADLNTAGVDASQLRESGLVAFPASGIETQATALPLVLDLDRLYLQRLHDYEVRLAARLRDWLAQPDLAVDEAVLAEVFAEARMSPDAAETDWQALAVRTGCRRPFAILSGGPGTGKTRTAAVLLRALSKLQPGLRIALAAPTGKAAARLQESIDQTQAELVKNEIPKAPVVEPPPAPPTEPAPPENGETVEAATGDDAPATEAPAETPVPEPLPVAPPPVATTLHRLLGASADGRRFRHSPENPLPYDLVLVDEASMVDLAMMCRLVTALKPSARLVLLGDKDQLASVDAGYVLGDICDAVGVDPAVASATTAVELRRNFRFGADSAIGRLATLVRAGDAAGTLAALRELPTHSDVSWQQPRTEGELSRLLGELFDQRLQRRFRVANAAEAVKEAGRLQILCAVRRGPFGVEGLNRAIEARLEQIGLREAGQTWYRGRAVLVVANDAQQGLFNGDLGVVWPDDKGQLRVWFQGGAGLRAFAPAQLPPHETAFAITVHKSQGSEFSEVLVVLPPDESPVSTRELVYTGLTRAKRKAELWATEPALLAAVQSRVRRASGLADRLRR